LAKIIASGRVWTPPEIQAFFFALAMSNAVEFRRVSGLMMRPYNAAGPYGSFGDLVQIDWACSKALGPKLVFPIPSSRLFAHKPPLRTAAFRHLQPVALRRKLEPGTPRRGPLRPKRHGRFCLPARLQSAFLVSAQAYVRAKTLQSHRVAQPVALRPSRQGSGDAVSLSAPFSMSRPSASCHPLNSVSA
jgi:hypothetical protein